MHAGDMDKAVKGKIMFTKFKGVSHHQEGNGIRLSGSVIGEDDQKTTTVK